MGSHQFQREYIEYLQDRNSQLHSTINEMKERYENKLLITNSNKNYVSSVFQEILSICQTLPKEIDTFFDEMSTAMGTLKNILLKKSKMVQLVNQISEAKANDKPNSFNIEHNSDVNTARKSGTAKVSPMINGHVISTEPRIYLSRVSRNLTPPDRSVLGPHQLSPIQEASPPTTPDLSRNSTQPIIVLEKLNLNHMECLSDSPNFKSKRHESWGKSMSIKEEPNFQEENNLAEKESYNSESQNINNNTVLKRENDSDPLEGPSWRNNENFSSRNPSKEQNSFVTVRRRKNRFSSIPNETRRSSVANSNENKNESFSGTPSDSNLNLQKDLITVVNESIDSSTHHSNASKVEESVESQSSPEYILGSPICIKKELAMTLKQPIISLEDCMADKNLKNMITLKTNFTNKCKKTNECDSHSSSTSNSSICTEGRKRRKAAPTNLTEPSLMTKLRRE